MPPLYAPKPGDLSLYTPNAQLVGFIKLNHHKEHKEK